MTMPASPPTFSSSSSAVKRSVSLLQSSFKCTGIKKNEHASIYCPQYENIGVRGMLEKAKQLPDLMLYLPDEKEIHLLPRAWLANVIYTKYG